MLCARNLKLVFASAALLGAASVVEAKNEGKQFRKKLSENEKAERHAKGQLLKKEDMKVWEAENKVKINKNDKPGRETTLSKHF